MRSIAAAGIAVLFGLGAAPVSAAPTTAAWQPWVSVNGVFDLGGPLTDGSLVAGGSGMLYRVTPEGDVSRFAPDYHDAGGEPYLAVSQGVGGEGCAFNQGDTYVLRLQAPIGLTRISPTGEVRPFASLDLPTLNGITFDDTGSFGRRLLVTGPLNGRTEVVAVDCSGATQVITRTAPVVEGGIAVAPAGFGLFGGNLIAPDELSGIIWAIAADGSARQVVDSGLPHGGDVGVESVAFVPPGVRRGGFLYYSDRVTPGNAHPGTDHVLRLSLAALPSTVEPSDLLAATEGGASMIAVHCGQTCDVKTVIGVPTTAHGEGHLLFALTPATRLPVSEGGLRTSASTQFGIAFVLIGVLLIAGLLIRLWRRG